MTSGEGRGCVVLSDAQIEDVLVTAMEKHGDEGERRSAQILRRLKGAQVIDLAAARAKRERA